MASLPSFFGKKNYIIVKLPAPTFKGKGKTV
jgi:hypothetical protein